METVFGIKQIIQNLLGTKQNDQKERETRDLLDDCIYCIILHLPVKSLLRFRCVSKHWLAVIDTDSFIKQHLTHSVQTKTNHNIVFNNADVKVYSVGLNSLTDQAIDLVLPLNPKPELTAIVLNPCNGLLCILCDFRFIIWNPFTRKHVEVPFLDPVTSHLFDMRTQPKFRLCYGFGYDYVSDDYKLVFLAQFTSTHESKTIVYSLRSDSWRSVQDNPDRLVAGFACYALVCGAVHWITEVPSHFDVAAFDLVTEKYKMVPLPRFFSDNKVVILLVSELGGCFSIVSAKIKAGVADVWVMKEYGVRESWTKIIAFATVDLSIGIVIPLAYSESGEEVLLMIKFEKLLWYNLEKKTSNFVDVCGLPKYYYPMICLESLVSLGEKAENDENEGAKEKKFLSAGFMSVLQAIRRGMKKRERTVTS